MTARERLAYVRGLLQGSDFLGSDEKTKEVWNGLLDVLEELSNEMDDIYDWQDEIEDYLDALDNDLMELEETVYEDEDEDEIVVVECPNCHEDIYVDESLFDDYDELVCPSCGSSICCECCDDDDDLEGDFDYDEDDE